MAEQMRKRKLISTAVILTLAACHCRAQVITQRGNELISNLVSGQQKGDPDHQSQGPVRSVTQGNCGLNSALRAISERNTPEFYNEMKAARQNYQDAYSALSLLTKNAAFQKPLDLSAYDLVAEPRFRNLLSLGDILNRMGMTALGSTKIIDKILEHSATQSDLDQLVRNSTDLTKFTMLFLSIMASQNSASKSP
jgi:hypothetical protein